MVLRACIREWHQTFPRTTRRNVTLNTGHIHPRFWLFLFVVPWAFQASCGRWERFSAKTLSFKSKLPNKRRERPTMPGHFRNPRQLCQNWRTKTNTENMRGTAVPRQNKHRKKAKRTKRVERENIEDFPTHAKARWAHQFIKLEQRFFTINHKKAWAGAKNPQSADGRTGTLRPSTC